MLKRMALLALTALVPLALAAPSPAAAQGTLRIGINEDPDVLDPTTNRLASGRQPLTALCDKLFDVSTSLELVPMLAVGHEIAADGLSVTLRLRPNVRFHDGDAFDAEAVAFNLNRHLTTTGSFRRAELAALDGVDVIDPLTLRIRLKRPQAYLFLIVLAERAGMMVSPRAARELGDRFGSRPVCAGPYSFVERVPQGRIVVQRFEGHWNRAENHFERIEYLPITDSTVRMSALRSGEIQIAERLTPTDLPQLANDARATVVAASDLGYHHIRFNTNNGDRGRLLGRDPRLRQAIEAAVDRRVLVQALFNNQYGPGNQFVNPDSPFYAADRPVPARDVALARRLLREAGAPNLTFTLLVPAERERQEAAQFIQAMLAEAGITMNIETQDNATMLQNARRGQFDAVFSFWSGRPHPDGNVFSHYTCRGPQNDGRFCNEELDAILLRAQEATDATERQALYRQANRILVDSRAAMILWHRRTFTGVSRRLQGFVAHPDSTIRLTGLRMN
jgi:peptide/nickel transport system substrate-binding protein